MKQIISTLALFFIVLPSHPMYPLKMKNYIARNSHLDIRYTFYSAAVNHTNDVNNIIQDFKAAVGENYMGELEQNVKNKHYVTLYVLGTKKEIVERLQNKPWFNSNELTGDVLARNLNCDFDEK